MSWQPFAWPLRRQMTCDFMHVQRAQVPSSAVKAWGNATPKRRGGGERAEWWENDKTDAMTMTARNKQIGK